MTIVDDNTVARQVAVQGVLRALFGPRHDCKLCQVGEPMPHVHVRVDGDPKKENDQKAA